MSLDVGLYAQVTSEVDVLNLNVTHNLVPMAELAGLYEVMWRPELVGATKGYHAIPHLIAGIAKLRKYPKAFRALNPENGWGKYEDLLAAAERMLAACERHPDGRLEVSR